MESWFSSPAFSFVFHWQKVKSCRSKHFYLLSCCRVALRAQLKWKFSYLQRSHTHTHALALHCTALYWQTFMCQGLRETFLRPALDVMNVFNLRRLFLVVAVVLVAFLVESTLLLILLLQCLHAARSTPSIHLQFPLTRNLHTHPKGC